MDDIAKIRKEKSKKRKRIDVKDDTHEAEAVGKVLDAIVIE
jgi:hypothetical protein